MNRPAPAYRYLGVSMIMRVPADFDRDALEDRIVQLAGCEGVNSGACEQPEGCPIESFGTCCTEDSETAFRWLLGPGRGSATWLWRILRFLSTAGVSEFRRSRNS